MSDTTFENQVSLGPYIYSPIGAHSMTQWYPDNVAASDDVYHPPVYEGLENLAPDSAMNQDTPETQAANLS
mgnify:CR=1 FL=1